MNLATVAARRLVLSRGAGVLAALFASGAGRSHDGIPMAEPPRSGPHGSTAQDPVSDGEWKQRQAILKPFHDKQRAIDKRRYRTYRAWYEQDADLKLLQSVSPSFRASVMYDRLKARDSIMESLSEKIDALWEAPFAGIQALAARWLGEIL